MVRSARPNNLYLTLSLCLAVFLSLPLSLPLALPLSPNCLTEPKPAHDVIRDKILRSIDPDDCASSDGGDFSPQKAAAPGSGPVGPHGDAATAEFSGSGAAYTTGAAGTGSKLRYYDPSNEVRMVLQQRLIEL